MPAVTTLAEEGIPVAAIEPELHTHVHDSRCSVRKTQTERWVERGATWLLHGPSDMTAATWSITVAITPKEHWLIYLRSSLADNINRWHLAGLSNPKAHGPFAPPESDPTQDNKLT